MLFKTIPNTRVVEDREKAPVAAPPMMSSSTAGTGG
jgi:hypothetical protein